MQIPSCSSLLSLEKRSEHELELVEDALREREREAVRVTDLLR